MNILFLIKSKTTNLGLRLHLQNQEQAGISEELNGHVGGAEVQEVMAGWDGTLFSPLLSILKILAFILSEKGYHWKALSRKIVFFLCFRRTALGAVLRMDCGEGEVGQVWNQRDQLEGYCNSPVRNDSGVGELYQQRW